VAQATRDKPGFPDRLRGPLAKGSREGSLILVTALALYFVMSLASYHPTDPGWSHSGPVERVLNQGGIVGAWLADVFLYLFGYMAWLFPVMVGYGGWMLYRGVRAGSKSADACLWMIRLSGMLLTIGAGCGLASLHFHANGALPLDAGGVFGNLVGSTLAGGVSALGGTLFLLALFLTGFTLFTGISWLAIMDVTGRYTLVLWGWLTVAGFRLRDYHAGLQVKNIRKIQITVDRKRTRKPPRIEPTLSAITPGIRVEQERQVPLFEVPTPDNALPELGLLDSATPPRNGVSAAGLEAMSRQVEWGRWSPVMSCSPRRA